MKLCLGIATTDFFDIANTIHKINATSAESVHFDVMDGIFVPQLTYGAKFIHDIRPHSDKIFEAHLMVADPLPLVDSFIDAGADAIILHIESKNFDTACDKIRKSKIKVGIALNIETPIEGVRLDNLDIVQIMTAKTGLAGQPFDRAALAKIEYAARTAHAEIIADGGINFDTAQLCATSGATGIVSGSFAFNQPSLEEAVKRFQGI